MSGEKVATTRVKVPKVPKSQPLEINEDKSQEEEEEILVPEWSFDESSVTDASSIKSKNDAKKSLPQKSWSYTKKALSGLWDFASSTSFNRALMILSAVFLFVVSPFAPWVSVIALIGAVGTITIGVSIEAYKKYELDKLHKEDVLLGKLLTFEEQKIESLQVLERLYKTNTKNLELGDNKIKDLLKKEFYKCYGDDKDKTYQSHLLENIVKVSIFTGPERFANIAISVIKLNPISIGITAALSIISYPFEVSKAQKYYQGRAMLLNSMEQAKKTLGISYESGKGLALLTDIYNLRLAEYIATQNLVSSFKPGGNPDTAMEKFITDRTMLFKEFTKKNNYFTNDEKRKEQLSDDSKKFFEAMESEFEISKKIEVQETTSQKVMNFLTDAAKVVLYGFSCKKTEDMFNPMRRHEDYGEKIEKLKTHTKQTEATQQKQNEVEQGREASNPQKHVNAEKAQENNKKFFAPEFKAQYNKGYIAERKSRTETSKQPSQSSLRR